MLPFHHHPDQCRRRLDRPEQPVPAAWRARPCPSVAPKAQRSCSWAHSLSHCEVIAAGAEEFAPAAKEQVLFAPDLSIMVAITIARIEDVLVAAVEADVGGGDDVQRRGVTRPFDLAGGRYLRAGTQPRPADHHQFPQRRPLGAALAGDGTRAARHRRQCAGPAPAIFSQAIAAPGRPRIPAGRPGRRSFAC